MKIDTITSQPAFEAERFDLRPLRRSDKGLLGLYMGDARVATNTKSIPHPLPPGTVDAYIARANAEDRVEDVWAIDGTKSGRAELLGLMTVERMDRDQCEIGYWVAPAFWNLGYASEAVRAIVDANPFQSKTMFAAVFQANAVSARVLTNTGFSYLGDAEAFSVSQNNTVKTWTYLKNLT